MLVTYCRGTGVFGRLWSVLTIMLEVMVLSGGVVVEA